MKRKGFLMLFFARSVLCLPAISAGDDGAPVFSREIRPILATKCLACHGPDASNREADLRLDVREVAVKTKAIVPGKPDASELVRRIETDDEDQQMPPPDSGHALNDREKSQLRRWIAAE